MTEPSVSVIMAVYNAGEYLAQALDSTLRQGLDEGGIEVIAVDDGSTDGSGELLDRFAAEHPILRPVHQANSGGPGAPRNAGLDLARGRYVFFLDADDMLAENALRDLVAVADEQGSDVVLGQVRGIDGRSARGATFPETRLRADLRTDPVFRTLGPWKLFRRSLIEDRRMRFRTDVKVAEDQPFVARAYLTAANISICADRDYYLLRQRADGGNVTRTKRGPAELVDAFVRLTEVVLEETEPGPLRDAALWRSVTWSLGKPLDARFLRGSAEDQQYVLEQIQTVLGPVLTPAVMEHQKPLMRTKTTLALDGEIDALRRLITWEKDRTKTGRFLRLEASGAALDLPEDLASEIGPERLHVPVPSARAFLTGSEAFGEELHLSGIASVRSASTPAPEVLVRLHNRESARDIDLPMDRSRAVELEDGAGLGFDTIVRTTELAEGVWDLWIVQRAGSTELATRFGSSRAEGIRTALAQLTPDGSEESSSGVVYFTKGAKNLSIDIGFRLHPRRRPLATVVGVLPGETKGTASVVLKMRSLGDVSGELLVPGAEPQELAARWASAGVLTLTVPFADLPPKAPVRIAVSNAAGRGMLELAAELDQSALRRRKLELVSDRSPDSPDSPTDASAPEPVEEPAPAPSRASESRASGRLASTWRKAVGRRG